MHKRYLALAASVACLCSTAYAQQATISIEGVARVVCRVQFEPSPAGGNGVLGRVADFCNSPDGYRLMVSYDPGGTGSIFLGDNEVVLNGSGHAEIQVAGPTNQTRELRYVPGSSPATNLTFGISGGPQA